MYINIDEEKGIACSPNLTFIDAVRLLGSALLQLMNDVDATAKENAKDSAEYENTHGEIYDIVNRAAGNVLDQFDSTRSPGTDLTAQAILEAENAILDRETSSDAVPEETTEEKNSPA